MADQRLLDDDRVDVVAAADDQVLRASREPDIAVGVEPAEIARVEPAVGQHRALVVARIEIARRHLRPAHQHMADRAQSGSRRGSCRRRPRRRCAPRCRAGAARPSPAGARRASGSWSSSNGPRSCRSPRPPARRSRVSMRRISSTGTVEPPETKTLSEERSWPSRGTFMIAARLVGTAPPIVTLLRSTMLHQSRTTLGLRAPSGVGITTVQPAATADSAPKIEPPTWNCGSGLSSTVPGGRSNISALLQAASVSAPWVWRASFGRPVVPPVWNSAATRVARERLGRERACRRAARRWPPRSRSRRRARGLCRRPGTP